MAPRKNEIVDFCNELTKLSKPQTTLPLPNRPENKKDNCSNLVIWTSNMTNIRIQKFFHRRIFKIFKIMFFMDGTQKK
jgi:hypothetical protein